MKKIFAIALVAIAALTASAKDLYEAIAIVESNGNNYAIGDKGKAVGRYQIWKIYVDDVNRICKLKRIAKRYTYADRTNPVKSLEMVKIYTDFYAARYERLTGKKATDEIRARIHNGGLNGWKKPATLKYWSKVKKEMAKAI